MVLTAPVLYLHPFHLENNVLSNDTFRYITLYADQFTAVSVRLLHTARMFYSSCFNHTAVPILHTCTHAHEGLSQYKCIIYQRMHGFQTCLFENCIWTLVFDSWRSWREAVPIQSTGLQWHSSLHWYFTKHYKIFQETIQGKLCRVPMCRCRNI